jgi:hypothetical protein
MRRHAKELLAVHAPSHKVKIKTVKNFVKGRVIRDLNHNVIKLYLPVIRSDISYAVVLHEIGHICGRYQRSRYLLIVEWWAWVWAKRHAVVWTPRMERYGQAALDWYKARPKQQLLFTERALNREQLLASADERMIKKLNSEYVKAFTG